jgi:hypothetical protein
MYDLDLLIKKLADARQLHSPIGCCACIIDGEGQKIIHASELPFVDFRESPDGDFIQIVFHGDDPRKISPDAGSDGPDEPS